MPGADKEIDLTERIEAFLSDLKRGGSGSGPPRGSSETARETTALLRRVTAQARWSSAGTTTSLQTPGGLSELWRQALTAVRDQNIT